MPIALRLQGYIMYGIVSVYDLQLKEHENLVHKLLTRALGMVSGQFGRGP